MNGTETVRFVIKRESADEITLAVVTADLDEAVQAGGLEAEQLFRAALTAAITDWMVDTSEGRDAWRNSSEDFNIGDLDHALGDETLTSILNKRGILNLKIEIISETTLCNDWMFDTVLADGVRIEID